MLIYEKSYGIIPFRKTKEGEWEVLLVEHQKGHWAFPKGHAEIGESPQATAERELFEETGLRVVDYLTCSPAQEAYSFFRKNVEIHKEVVYFCAFVAGEIVLQTEEIREATWLSPEQAFTKITFLETKDAYRKAITSLRL